VILFGGNKLTKLDVTIARQLRQIGGEEIRRASSAIVVGYRSLGGSSTLSKARVVEVRRQLLRINPLLRVTTRISGLKVPQCAQSRNECALVELGR
jgi:hypothetical protein